MSSVKDVEEITIQGYRGLRFTWNGQSVEVHTYQFKTPLLDAGYAFLGRYEGTLPANANLSLGDANISLEGFTDDPEVVRVVKNWLTQDSQI